MDFHGKHILITGSSSGIGEATARYLVDKGAIVTLVARREDKLQAICNNLLKISKGHQYIIADLSKDEEISKLVKQINPIDGLVHAAGIVFPLPIKFIQRKHLEKVWNINSFSPILLTSSMIANKKINEKASIVFISSVSTQHPYQGGAIYISSKAAIEGYSKSVALELSSKLIRSNVISPALVKTQIFEDTIEASDHEKLKEYESNYPFGFGEPEDIAKAIAFFLSDDSKWITGQNLVMDGGLTLSSKK